MTSRPILFSGPMIRALLSGVKTQTRRVVKPQPVAAMVQGSELPEWWSDGETRIRCPHGSFGDQLWVRETWGQIPMTPSEAFDVYYRADKDTARVLRWHPSIHMPRWASRITLEITSVRVERLNEISEADAKAEGIESRGGLWRDYSGPGPVFGADPVVSFRSLWQSIHGPGSWDASPWVWVIGFRRIKP